MGSECIARETYIKTNTVYTYSIGWWGGKQVLIDLNLPFRGVGSGVIARDYIWELCSEVIGFRTDAVLSPYLNLEMNSGLVF